MTYFTAHAQQTSETSGAATTTIKAESRLVLVDVVVTDKKGNYIPDLTEKDFRVWEDDQEQKVTSFSSEVAGTTGDSQKRHLVLFFDDDSMQPADQGRARAAAGQFVEAHSGPSEYIAVNRLRGNHAGDSEFHKRQRPVEESCWNLENVDR